MHSFLPVRRTTLRDEIDEGWQGTNLLRIPGLCLEEDEEEWVVSLTDKQLREWMAELHV